MLLIEFLLMFETRFKVKRLNEKKTDLHVFRFYLTKFSANRRCQLKICEKRGKIFTSWMTFLMMTIFHHFQRPCRILVCISGINQIFKIFAEGKLT